MTVRSMNAKHGSANSYGNGVIHHVTVTILVIRDSTIVRATEHVVHRCSVQTYGDSVRR